MIKREIKICMILLCHFYLSSSVKFDHDAYKNIVVKIPDSFTKYSIEKIQDLFREASSLLYTATKHRAFYNEVIFLFDSLYNIQELLNDVSWSNATSKELQSPTFTFSSTWDKIRTRQNAFCGKINEAGIVLPADVTNIVPRDLVTNWAKYRYGVFEETPQPGNGCFLDNAEWKLTGCYDVNHLPNSIQVDFQDGVYVCTDPGSIRDLFGNADLKSSLMWSSDIETVQYFCSDKTHNSLAPTKHNLFCDGRSVGNVIESSPDFQNIGTTNFVSTNFQYVQIKPPRIIFLLQNCIKKKRSKITKAVLKFFHEYLIEEGAEVGVVTFNLTSDEVKRTKELTAVQQPIGQRNNLLGSGVKWFDLDCSSDETNSTLIGLEEARKMFGDDQRMNIVVLIGDAKTIVTAINFPLIHERARLLLLPYLDEGLELKSYQDISKGMVPSKDIYPLVDNPNEFGQELINAALLDIFNMAYERKRNFLVYKKIHQVDDKHTKLSDTFATDGRLEGTIIFKVSCDSEDSDDVVEFNGKIKSSKPFDFMDKLSPNDSKVEHWNFTIETDTSPNICVVLAFIIQTNSMTQEIDTSYHKITPIEDSTNQLIILNAALAISQAKLKAEVTNLINGNSFTMGIFDDGQDPDLMENDGFYSGYLTLGVETHPGLYYVNVVTSYSDESTEIVSRYDYLGSIAIYEKQILPPARVVDLKMISVNPDRSLATLSWAKPRTFNYAASFIEVKYGINWEDLNERNFDNAPELRINSTQGTDPNIPGKITIECEMPRVDIHFYLAVRTRNDFYNVTSRVSNRVRVINGKLLTTATMSVMDTSTVFLVTAEVTTDKPNCNCTTNQSNNSVESALSKRTIILILASSFTVFFIIIIICNLVLCWACDKDNALPGGYKFKTTGPVNLDRRGSSNQTSTRRRSFRNSDIRPTSHTLNQRAETNSDWTFTPNHLINNNARRSTSPSQFIVVSNDSPRNDSRSTIAARTSHQPNDAMITFVSPGSRRATTQNRLIFDGSNPEELYGTPSSDSENVRIQAVNYAMNNMPHKQDSFDLGEV